MPPTSAPDDRRFFLVHIPKTAGTTLRNRFRHQFPIEAIFPNGSDRDVDAPYQEFRSVDRLLERWHARRDEIRFLHGHFPLSVIELLDADFVTITVLRPPVERTLSLLRHRRKVSPAHAEMSLVEIYEDREVFDSLIANGMTRILGLQVGDYGDNGITAVPRYDDTLLEHAKQALTGVDLFGLQPHFEEFCTELAARYDLDLGEPLRSNTTEPEPPPDGLVERIIHDNPLDVALYEHATRLYDATRPSWLT